jgi:DNA-binding MarR family transcriptional regulator
MPDRLGSVGYLTNWAARLLARTMDDRLRPLGLSSGQLPVFFALAGGDELTQRDLARLAGIEQPTMAATLGRMERDGLVGRRPDPRDGRSALVRLTPAAMEKVPAVVAAVSAVNGQALSGFGGSEADHLRSLLLRVIANLDETGGGR